MDNRNNMDNMILKDFIKFHNNFETKYLKIKHNTFNNKHHNLKQFNHTKKTLHTRKLRW